MTLKEFKKLSERQPPIGELAAAWAALVSQNLLGPRAEFIAIELLQMATTKCGLQEVSDYIAWLDQASSSGLPERFVACVAISHNAFAGIDKSDDSRRLLRSCLLWEVEHFPHSSLHQSYTPFIHARDDIELLNDLRSAWRHAFAADSNNVAVLANVAHFAKQFDRQLFAEVVTCWQMLPQREHHEDEWAPGAMRWIVDSRH